MRYYISNCPQLLIEEDNTISTRCTLQDMFTYFANHEYIGLDTETSGLDPYTKRLLLIQFGDEYNQYVLDSTIDINLLKPFLEDDRYTWVLQNAKFDLKWLLHHKITVKYVWDTYLVEKLLYLGYPPGLKKLSLDAICMQYLKIKLNKSIREQFKTGGITTQGLVYACEDVKYLVPIMHAQHKEVMKKRLFNAVCLENKFVAVLAYIEYCGVKLDVNK